MARTLGATSYMDPAGGDAILTWRHPSAMRPVTPIATISLDADDILDGQAWPLSRSVESRPTRITVNWPTGSDVVIDAAAEATGGSAGSARREESIETTAVDEAGAGDAAYWRLSRSAKLRPTSIVVDFTSSPNSNTLWSALKDMRPGDRVRLSNIPSAMLGYTYTDQFVYGWTESYSELRSSWSLDPAPADAPPEAVFDDSTYGRWSAGGTMSVSSGTAVGNTGTGTIVVDTVGGGAVFTTTGADWPMDLDWNGERITITAAPGASTTPQTLTITARGVAPTIARAHSAGEQIDVWMAAAWAL